MSEVTLEQPPPPNAHQHWRWNFAVNVWDEIFILLGVSLVSRETVLPVLVAQLTDSKLAIGLIPAIFSLGVYLPQLLVANFSERMRYKKPYIMLVSGPGERGAYLMMGLVIWWLAERSPNSRVGPLFYLAGRLGPLHWGGDACLVRHDRQGNPYAPARAFFWHGAQPGRAR